MIRHALDGRSPLQSVADPHEALFRNLVEPELGWPVYVVVPARDFAFVISKKDQALLGQLGTVVLREFNESGYPITADVLEVGDNGLTAIGSFAPKE